MRGHMLKALVNTLQRKGCNMVNLKLTSHTTGLTVIVRLGSDDLIIADMLSSGRMIKTHAGEVVVKETTDEILAMLDGKNDK